MAGIISFFENLYYFQEVLLPHELPWVVQPVPLVKLVVIRTQEMLAGIGKTPLGMAYLAGDLPAVRCMGRIGHDRQGVLLSLCAGKKYVSGA